MAIADKFSMLISFKVTKWLVWRIETESAEAPGSAPKNDRKYNQINVFELSELSQDL
jgi:hypothetical protein